MKPIDRNSTIGILGAGQLGRMLAMAAARLGFRSHVFAPEPGPATDVAHEMTVATYHDKQALGAFARSCEVVTYEFETVPGTALDIVSPYARVRPGRRALTVSQDRLTEKDFLTGLGLKTARYRDIPSLAALRATLAILGRPAILKTRRDGYDGKGQIRIEGGQEGAASEAFDAFAGTPAILEENVTFALETSVIVARGANGATACYEPGLNRHEGGILRETTVPADLSAATREAAIGMAERIVEALDYVGVMGVEFFVTADGAVLVNEIAPRVHNSGHWTEAGCAVDQFEQHIRAITGLPLGDAARVADVRMENLIGPDGMAALPDRLAAPRARVHLYGKAEAREGRKMGHVNHVAPPS